jgi:hypothetical protein
VAEAAGDAVLVALVNYRLGIANVMLGDMKEANAALKVCLGTLGTEEGRRLFAFGGSPFSFACSFRAWALAELGLLDEAVAVGRAGFDNAISLVQPYTIVVSTFGYSAALFRYGQWEKAAEILDVGREQVDLYGIAAGGTWLFARRALVAANLGDAALTDLMIERSTAGATKTAVDTFYETLLADAELRLGRFEHAASRARRAVASGTQNNEMAAVAWGSLILAEALTGLEQGDDTQTQAAIRRATELADRLSLVPLANRIKHYEKPSAK